MRIDFASSQQTTAFNKNPPKNYTNNFIDMQQQTSPVGSLKNTNITTQNEQKSDVDQQAESRLSKEILVEYLEALAIADSAKSFNAKIGYAVTAASITIVAFLAIKYNSLVQENLVLNSHLKNCRNLLADQNSAKIHNFDSFNLINQGPYLGAAANIISNFFSNAPSLMPVEESCKHVPSFVGDLQVGVQKLCLNTIFNKVSDGHERATLTFTAEPLELKAYNGTSPLQNRVHIFCEEQKTTGPSVFDFSSSCTGSFEEKRTAEAALKDRYTISDPICKVNYSNSEVIKALLDSKGISGTHIATEDGRSQKTVFTSHFNNLNQLKVCDFKDLNDLLSLN